MLDHQLLGSLLKLLIRFMGNTTASTDDSRAWLRLDSVPCAIRECHNSFMVASNAISEFADDASKIDFDWQSMISMVSAAFLSFEICK